MLGGQGGVASRVLLALGVAAALSSQTACRRAPTPPPVPAIPAPPRDNADLPRAFAHALGGVGGFDFTNSVEAFELAYGNGCRFFEADLWLTPDHHEVFFHDHKEGHLGLTPGFTWSEFMHAKLAGRLTPIDADMMASFFAEKTDWMMLADAKSDERESLTMLCEAMKAKGVDCRRRLIPHIFNLDRDYEVVESMGFPRMVLALYRLGATKEDIVTFVREHPKVVAVNIPVERWSPQFGESLNQLNVKAYLHTVNDPAQIQRLVREGAWGMISDTACPSADAFLGGADASSTNIDATK